MMNLIKGYSERLRRRYFLLIILMLALLPLGCRERPKQEPGEPKPTPITVGYLPVSTSLPNWVAKSEGFAEKLGLNIEFKRYANSNLLLMALIKGEIQATSVCADEPILAAVSKGQRGFEIYLQEILTTDRVFDAFIVKKDSSIRSLSDLQAKTIACFPGSQLRAYLTIILDRAGINPQTVRVVQLPPPNMLPALESGTVDACFALEPVITIGESKSLIRIIAGSPISRYIGEGKSICAASYLISSQWADKHPQSADAFVKAVYEAVKLIKLDYVKTSKLYPEFTAIPSNIASKVVITDFATIEKPDVNGIEKEIEILRDAGVIKGDVPVEQLFYHWRTKE